MVTLSKKLKNAAKAAPKDDDGRRAFKKIYVDHCYMYATNGCLLYRGRHDLNIKVNSLVDMSDAKKGKLTLREYPKSQYFPDCNASVPKYSSDYTIKIKAGELLAAAKSITTFLKDSDDSSCKVSFRRDSGLIVLRAWNNGNYIRLNMVADMDEVKSNERFNIYINPVLLVKALQGFNKRETISIDFYGPLKPFTVKDIAGDQLYLIAPIRKY